MNNRETDVVYFQSSCPFLLSRFQLFVGAEAGSGASAAPDPLLGSGPLATGSGAGWLGSSSAPQRWSSSARGSPAPLPLLLMFSLTVVCWA